MTMKRGINLSLMVKLVLAAMLAGNSLEAGFVFYRNTFDAGGDNVGLGSDSTEPTVFFTRVSGGTLTSETFDGNIHTNHGDASADGLHARYVDAAGSGNTQHGIVAIPGSFAALVAQMNTRWPGKYDLTFSVDLGVQERTDAWKYLNEGRLELRLLGTGSAGNGSWTMILSEINGVDNETNFRRYSWNGMFDLTDVVQDQSLYGENEFLVGSFTGFYMRYTMASNHIGGSGQSNPISLNIDNLTFSSWTIPEPTSLALLGLGGLLLVRRRVQA